MSDSIWFTTRSRLFHGGEETWEEVAAYTEPLTRFLARRYRWLSDQDREDLVQDILLEIQRSLAERHDRSRGRFRALLQTVVHRRVADVLRARRGQPLTKPVAADLAAPSPQDVDDLDVEAALLTAFERCRDRFTQGRDRDPDVVYALADRILHGLTNTEIARRNGVSEDRVARLIARGRDEVFRQLLAAELQLDEADAALREALKVFKASLRSPTDTAAVLSSMPGRPALREELGVFLERFRAALGRLRGADTASGDELRQGLDVILGDVRDDRNT